MSKNLAHIALVAAALFSTSAFAITVNLSGRHILSNDFADVEVIDRVCNRNLGTFRIQGNQLVKLQVCANSSGHGDIARRNLTNRGDWSGASFLRENDEIYP